MGWPSKGFEKHIEEAIKMYSAGNSLEEVAGRFGVLRGTVTYHFKKKKCPQGIFRFPADMQPNG